MNDIIVGVDRSTFAMRAAETAAELAAALDANLHIVMSVKRTKPVLIEVGSDVFHSDAFADADQYLNSITLSLPHSSVTHAVGLTAPAALLCQEARRLRARAVVIGDRRVRRASRPLRSFAGDVTKGAPCDVIIVRTSASVGPTLRRTGQHHSRTIRTDRNSCLLRSGELRRGPIPAVPRHRTPTPRRF